MPASELRIVLIIGTFILAGCVKGVTGMGLPTVAMGLLGLLMTPAEAAIFLMIPSLTTNLWQFLAGPHRFGLLCRMWPMLLTISIATWAAAGMIAGTSTGRATMYLGLALVSYAALGLSNIRMAVDTRYEAWLSPLVGAATGVITGATGVFVIPAVPYLQALEFDKDDLVQVLGLSFTVSTLALALGLMSCGAIHASAIGASMLCTAPALVGMFAGQALRARIDARTFRILFFVGLLLLGGDLVTRTAI
jgi:uncharacterized membrane protein YfcA